MILSEPRILLQTMLNEANSRILDHAIGQRSAFTAERLIEEYFRIRGLSLSPQSIDYTETRQEWLTAAPLRARQA